MAQEWGGGGGVSIPETAYALARRFGSGTLPGMASTQIWFPAKRYGYGWGLPCAWQGWVVMGLFLVLQVGGAFAIMGSGRKVPPARVGWFVAYSFVLAGLLICVCRLKGETPRWRWGGEE